MSEFYSGKWKDVDFVSVPFGIRKFRVFRYLPFFTAQKVKFKINIYPKGQNIMLLDNIPVMLKYSSEKEGERLAEEVYTLNENKDEIIITSPGLYGGDILDYWLGTPNFPDSVKAVQLQANWKDKIWFAFFSILGSIFIVFLGWLLGLIKF